MIGYWDLILGIWFLEFGIWNLVFGIWIPILTIHSQSPKHLMPKDQFSFFGAGFIQVVKALFFDQILKSHQNE